MVRDSSDDDSDSIDPSSISITIQGIKNLRFIILIICTVYKYSTICVVYIKLYY